MDPLAYAVAARFKLARTAGGIDPGEDVHPILSTLAATLGHSSDWDIAHATYAFDYIAFEDKDSRTSALSYALATEYAQRFAGWLGYVFLDRANMTRRSTVMKGLEEGLGKWVEDIPNMLVGSVKTPSSFIPEGAGKFFREDRLDALGAKILRVVQGDWKHSSKQADGQGVLPISWNPEQHTYEIPTSNLTYQNRNKLRELGFEYQGDVWSTKTLDTQALAALGLVAHIEKVHAPVAPAIPATMPSTDPGTWFFEGWLPKNIERFSKAFNEYGRAEGVAYSFKFQVTGRNVNVVFTRNISTIEGAVRELTDRYGGESDREGWMTAIGAWHKLRSSSGKAAMHAVDMANNLEHSHGAMMEHFPPGVRSWYPKFLDFKYTADIWHMIRAIREEDLRTVATELMPMYQRTKRLLVAPTDYRTPKGLVLEIASQPGKAMKKKMLQQVIAEYPKMADQIVGMLKDRGLVLL